MTKTPWPFRFGVFLERKEHPENPLPWKLPAILILGTNAYILLGMLNSVMFSTPFIFNTIWFIAQFWSMLFLIEKLKGRFDSVESPALEKLESQVSAGMDIVVRYRPFIAIERWLKERFGQKKSAKGSSAMVAWFILPVMMLVGAFILMFVAGSAPSAVPAVTTAGAAAANTSFITLFLSSLLGITGFCTYVYVRQPTHLAFGPDGVRFLWRHKLLFADGKYRSWQKMHNIAVVRPPGKTSPVDDLLRFSASDGSKTDIKMDSIESIEDRETVLNAIKKWAPKVSRDPSVEQALLPPADYSYTELWLQALTAPPKRERLAPLLPGAVLREGRYKVRNTLGTGGQGQAYLCSDKESEKEVVLKEFILPVFVDVNVRRGALEQFENEARILKQLLNPQIVQLIDFFVEDHRAYLVLEHIDGASLREIVKNKGRLPERQVRLLAMQMCDILHYLHGLTPPVVHRDFTPDNLILRKDGTLKLIDFNVARQEVESTTSGTVVGKHAYLPPEQFRGMPEVQSDIYAMGATLHFLLTGQDPEPIAVSHPKNLVDEISTALNEIVEHATAVDIKKRYNNIDQVKIDLETKLT